MIISTKSGISLLTSEYTQSGRTIGWMLKSTYEQTNKWAHGSNPTPLGCKMRTTPNRLLIMCFNTEGVRPCVCVFVQYQQHPLCFTHSHAHHTNHVCCSLLYVCWECIWKYTNTLARVPWQNIQLQFRVDDKCSIWIDTVYQVLAQIWPKWGFHHQQILNMFLLEFT